MPTLQPAEDVPLLEPVDEEDERPRRRRRSAERSTGMSPRAQLIIGGVIGALILGAGIGIALLVGGSKEKKKTPTFTPNPQPGPWQQPPPNPNWQPPPAPDGVPFPAPPGPGPGFPGAPPPGAPAEPPRQPFNDGSASRLDLKDRPIRVDARIDNTDPIDPKTGRASKIYLVPLESGRVYLFEADGRAGLGSRPYLRVEDQQGTEAAKPRDDFQPLARVACLPPQNGTYRVVVSNALGGLAGEFTFHVKEVQDGDPLPQGSLPERKVEQHNMAVAKKTAAFLSAAITPNCKSAWVAYPQGKLEHFSCPDFAVKGRYTLPRQSYQLAADGRGRLYAAVLLNPNPAAALPWWDLGPADLHIYDTKAFPAEGAVKPVKVLPLKGSVAHLYVSPDDRYLYFLDTLKHKVGRVDLEKGAVDLETDKIDPKTTAMCVTPDGKKLYTCASTNVVQQLDAATLEVVKTIRIDRGKPNGIQATDGGYVFLNSGDGGWTHVFLLNAGRDYRGTARVLDWAPVYSTHSIRLSPDQKCVYAYLGASSGITALSISERPALFKGQQCGAVGLDGVNARGGMEISRDGRFLFCDRGLIVTLGQ